MHRRNIIIRSVGVLMALGMAAMPAIGEEAAPNFTLQNRAGETVSLEGLRGKVVMINFWATWCGPCRTEMPLLDAIYQRYQALGFELLGVNVEQNARDADEFLRQSPVSFPVLLDPANSVSRLFDVPAMPSTVIVDRQGNIRVRHHGYKAGDENEYQDHIRALIRERS